MTSFTEHLARLVTSRGEWSAGLRQRL